MAPLAGPWRRPLRHAGRKRGHPGQQMPTKDPSRLKRYEALAAELTASISGGVLRPGDRLPSVRQVRSSRSLSASTVFQAYYLMEARGLIRARERSGYYVADTAAPKALPPEPDTPSTPGEAAVSLAVSDHVFEILESTMVRDVVPLGSAFPSPLLFPLQRLGRVMAATVQKLDPWSTVDDLTPGHARLRRQIALRYLADGIHVPTEEIVITSGALDALNLCLTVATRPGDAVLIESPCFYAALQALERLGLEAIEVPTHPCEGMELEALERAIQRHGPKACWLMTNFQNPLGGSMPEAKKKALVALLTRHGVALIEDDVYGELYFGDRRPVPAKAFDTEGLVMHCSSFSKSLAPGYRIGWAMPGRFTQQVARMKLNTTLTASAPAQAGLATYLEKGGYDKHLRRLRHTLESQQAGLVAAIARSFPAHIQLSQPGGGYFLWVEFAPGFDTLALHQQALAQGISIAPGPMFSAHQGFRNCIRLNYGHPWDAQMEAAVATLGSLAKNL